jgi:hypothetical protein
LKGTWLSAPHDLHVIENIGRVRAAARAGDGDADADAMGDGPPAGPR